MNELESILVLKALKEAYTLGRNKTANWCAEHAVAYTVPISGYTGVKVDKESILEAKTTKDLDI